MVEVAKITSPVKSREVRWIKCCEGNCVRIGEHDFGEIGMGFKE